MSARNAALIVLVTLSFGLAACDDDGAPAAGTEDGGAGGNGRIDARDEDRNVPEGGAPDARANGDAQADAGPALTRAELADIQGDLMLWAPALKPDCTTGEDPVTHIRCVSDQGATPRGILAGWVWTLSVVRYPAAQREILYQAARDRGYTHFAVEVTACAVGGGYHGLYPVTDCTNADATLNTVLRELVAHGLIPICAGVSPDDPVAPGLDRSLCKVALTDWDNSVEADCRVQAVSKAFPDALVYYELPAGAVVPEKDACSPSPFPASGADWVRAARTTSPNFVGVAYEVNQPDGLAANASHLESTHVFWSTAQEVLFETDTYWKFWDNLASADEQTYNDALREKAPWLVGYMSGGTSHPPARTLRAPP